MTMTSIPAMTSVPTVAPANRGAARDGSGGDVRLLFACELFVVVLILNAVLITIAAPVDLASLYFTTI
jgi:hypothetical protein